MSLTGQLPAQPIQPAPEINLRAYAEILWRRKWLFLQVFVVVLAAGLAVTAMNTPVYRTQARFLVPAPSYMLSIYDSNNPIAPILQQNQPDSLETQLQVLQSEPFIAEARRAAGIKDRPGIAAPSVTVEATPQASVIVINAEGGDPVDVQRVANKMVELHERKMAERNESGLRTAMQFVQARKVEAERALTQARDHLGRYLQQPLVTQRLADRAGIARDYAEVQGRVESTRSSLRATELEIARLRGEIERLPAEAERLETRDNPQYLRARERLGELTLQREELLADYQPESARVKALDRGIARLEKFLAGEPPKLENRTRVPNAERNSLRERLSRLQAERWGLQREHESVGAQLASIRSVLDAVAPVESRQAELVAERDRQQANYTQFADKLRDLELRQIAGAGPTARLIQQAYPGRLVQARGSTQLLLTLVLALMVATAMTLLQEFLDDRINNPDDLQRVTSLPALAHVPMLGRDQPRLVSALPGNSHVVEAYRALRSSIGFAAIDAPIRRILVTSASKGEGKSVTSMNLATIMALDGKRVVLVDADLRKPSLHHLTGLPNEHGLSELLAGLATLDDVLQETETNNLQVICSGPVPPNPAELLGSRALDQVLDRLEAEADVIILDSPPCIPVTDPLVMAARVDGVVLVVHVGQTRKGALRQAEQLLTRARARLLGTVFNRVQLKKGGGYYYHGYGYYGSEPLENGRGAGRKKKRLERGEEQDREPVGRA